MKLKIVITPAEFLWIRLTLTTCGQIGLANELHARIQDPANDGPEVAILSVERQP